MVKYPSNPETPTQTLAQQFRAMADNARAIDGDYLRSETTDILEVLEALAKTGMGELHTNNLLDDVIIQRLRWHGFTVITVTFDGEQYNTVKW